MLEAARFDGSYEHWRAAAHARLAAGRHPSAIRWLDQRGGQDLFPGLLDDAPLVNPDHRLVPMPAGFESLARTVSYHRDERKWRLLYSLWWRWLHGERQLLKVDVDHEVYRLRAMERQVRKAVYRVEAFVRFRLIQTEHGEQAIAWHRPEHPVLPLVAPSFVSRFRPLRWSLLTPEASAHWDGATLTYGPGVPGEVNEHDDDVAELWRTYYASVFNPARIKLKAMQAQMPARHWAALPEAPLIAQMVARAPLRVDGMLLEQRQRPGAGAFLPSDAALPGLQQAALACRGCALYEHATGTVFGEGPPNAALMLVGEQPGDEEDLIARPFVGPAGLVLDRALAEAGLDRGALYLTNAVKHFKFVPAGRFRRHQRPDASEVAACRPWLEAEIAAVKPRLVVSLGATAARSLLGATIRLHEERGKARVSRYGTILPTIHPAATLRVRDKAAEQRLFGWLVEDLRTAARLAARA